MVSEARYQIRKTAIDTYGNSMAIESLHDNGS